MTRKIKYTLLTDGSSDRVLIPIIDWLLRSNLQILPEGAWADLSFSQHPGTDSLENRIRLAVEYYPCEFLFIHRDCENQTWQQRKQEIENACMGQHNLSINKICILPKRMTETWLLINEKAIRYASGNPNGRINISVVMQM